MSKLPRVLGLAFVASAAVLLAASLKFPLWQLRMEAPQYRDEEALRVVVHANRMSGDLREIAVLNQYIGVHAPTELPQFRWLPGAILAGAVLGLGAGFLPLSLRRVGLVTVALALSASLGVATWQAQKQMYDVGHKRDRKTKMAQTKDFTPPLFGTAKLAQFTLTARLGPGALLIGSALGLQFAAAWVARANSGSPGFRSGFFPKSQRPSVPPTREVTA